MKLVSPQIMAIFKLITVQEKPNNLVASTKIEFSKENKKFRGMEDTDIRFLQHPINHHGPTSLA
eukprot:Awhi_evm1s1138